MASTSFVKILPIKLVQTIEKQIGASAVLALKRLDKIATGKTAQSIRTESQILPASIEISVFGGGGLKYIIEGKPPNTKLPVKKVGNTFELIQEVKDWKAVRNFRGSDFVLARAIARNEQKPIDVASITLEIFNQLYGDKISSQLLSIYAQAIGQQATNV